MLKFFIILLVLYLILSKKRTESYGNPWDIVPPKYSSSLITETHTVSAEKGIFNARNGIIPAKHCKLSRQSMFSTERNYKSTGKCLRQDPTKSYCVEYECQYYEQVPNQFPLSPSCPGYNCANEGQICPNGVEGSSGRDWICRNSTWIPYVTPADSCAGYDCQIEDQRCNPTKQGSSGKTWICKNQKWIEFTQ